MTEGICSLARWPPPRPKRPTWSTGCRKERWTRPPRVSDWDLRTLLNHTILWTSYSAERRAHGESVAEDLMTKDFTAEPGFRDDYARQIDRAVKAWCGPRRPGKASSA